MSEASQHQMMTSCAFCGESTLTVPPGGMLTVRSTDGRVGVFAVHTGCAIQRLHPRAQALLAAAPIIPQAE